MSLVGWLHIVSRLTRNYCIHTGSWPLAVKGCKILALTGTNEWTLSKEGSLSYHFRCEYASVFVVSFERSAHLYSHFVYRLSGTDDIFYTGPKRPCLSGGYKVPYSLSKKTTEFGDLLYRTTKPDSQQM